MTMNKGRLVALVSSPQRLPANVSCGAAKGAMMLLFSLLCWPSVVDAQSASTGDVVRRSVSESVSAPVRAQATANSQTHATETEIPTGPILNPIAFESAKLDLDLKTMRTYWDKKDEHYKEKWKKLERSIELNRAPMVKRRARVAAVFERAFNDPATARSAIRSGKLFNFLLDQIGSHSGLASHGDVSFGMIDGLPPLDDDSVRLIQVQISAIGGPVAVSLTDPLPSLFRTWPFLFRDPLYHEHRTAVTEIAHQLFDGQVNNDRAFELSQQFEHEFEALSRMFYQNHPPEKRKHLSMIQWRRLREADEYLFRINQTFSRMVEVDLAEIQRPVYTTEYEPGERNLATLCRFMLQNGIQFGAAKPGSEFVYDRLYPQFRDLCSLLTVDPDADWIHDAMINLDLNAQVANE